MKNRINKYFKILLLSSAFLGGIIACVPSIDLDLSQWGKHNDITNVQAFRIENYNLAVPDYYDEALENVGDTIYGVRRIVYNSSLTWDTLNNKSNVIINIENTASAQETLNNLGLFISHRADKVTPLGDAPTLGIPSKFETGKGYQYELLSADGDKRVWYISIELTNP